MDAISDERVEIVKRKGGEVLFYKGYQYYKHRVYKNNSARWVCSRKRKCQCVGSITVYDGKIQKATDHAVNGDKMSCLPNEARNTVDMTIEKIKSEAANTTEPVPRIYNKFMAPIYDMGLDKVTKISYESSKTAIYSQRKQAFDVKKLSYKNVKEVEIPAKFRSNILGDYITEEARIIVICSDFARPLLANINEYYADGTFQSTPPPFVQLFTLHGNIGSTTNVTKIVPLIYCLMSDRTENSYLVVYEIIKSSCKNWNPKVMHCDFEVAITNSLKEVVPEVQIRRCYYHLVNSMWRKAKSLKLTEKSNRRIVGLCTALPLLPEDYIQEGWEYISSRCEGKEKIKPFIAYMQKYWMRPDFIREWCVYNQLHRTNNFAEGWHSRLNRAINKNYKTVAKLLDALDNDMSINKMTVANVATGQTPNKRRRVQKENDTDILYAQLKLVHKEITVGHFLEMLR